MFPVIYESDELIISREDFYNIGYVIVFFFNRQLIVHRLLRQKNDFYYCKGDNAFRLETIRKCNILGKVIKVIRNNVEVSLKQMDKTFVDMSYRISRIFFRNFFDIEKTKSSNIYKEYYKKYLSLESEL